MRLQRHAKFFLLFGLLIALPTNATAADWRDGKFAYLLQYVGTTNYKAIVNDRHVRQAMEELLGDAVPHLLKNLQTSGTVDVEGPFLIIWGHKPHEAHLERGILIVDIFDGKVHAGIFSNGVTTIYSKLDKETERYFEPERHYGLIPEALRAFARWDDLEKLIEHEPKANFRWVR